MNMNATQPTEPATAETGELAQQIKDQWARMTRFEQIKVRHRLWSKTDLPDSEYSASWADVEVLLSSHADLLREREVLRLALVSAAVPYEALLLDAEARRWIAPQVWEAMETAVMNARAALGDKQ